MRIEVLTLFPEVMQPVLQSSILGRAIRAGALHVELNQVRDHATDRHRSVDDTVYGGGPGMLLRADVLHRAWVESRRRCSERLRTILLSPQGTLLTQQHSKDLYSAECDLILVCGHYEGVDERFIEECVDEELSIGDYVLTGGELGALVLIDVLARQVPGVVGNEASVEKDSLWNGLLKEPSYTKPREFLGRKVPDVLLSGDHAAIEAWRQQQCEVRTQTKRPDLWKTYVASRG
jgi:tRNA (guanine37-N1)-methyltransferase